MASSFSLKVVAFLRADPALDLDFYVVFKDTDIESCNELIKFGAVADCLSTEFLVEFLTVMTLALPELRTTIFFLDSFY